MKITTVFRIFALTLMLTISLLMSHAMAVSTDELIIHYSFDEETHEGTDIMDLSGNDNHGLLIGNLNVVDGKVNGAMEFPGGAANYIAVREHFYDDLFPAITIAVWIKTAARGMIASWDRSEFFRFGAGDDVLGNLTFIGFDVCCPIIDWHGNVEVTDDEWHHVVATFDAEMKRIYVDGELDVEAPTDTNTKMIGKQLVRYGFIGIGSEAVAFNGARGPNWVFTGLMDEFLLFHRAISAEEVETLAKGTTDPFAVEPADKLSITWGKIKSMK